MTDAAVVIWATVGALIVRFGLPDADDLGSAVGNHTLLSMALAVCWWLMLYLFGSRESTVLGHGTEEYKRVIRASLWLFGLVAIISYALRIDTARGYVGVALPAGIVFLLLSRLIVRKFLHIERSAGKSVQSVLIVGDVTSSEHLASSLASQPMAGYKPIGAYIPGNTDTNSMLRHSQLPVIGKAVDEKTLIAEIRDFAPDAVALSGGTQLHPGTIRALGWALAEMNIRLIMVPALTDVAGPRIHMQPLAGLPLVHVSTPNLEKGQRFLKRSFDMVGALSIILILLPVWIGVALSIRVDSRGPIIFRQKRIGTAGKPFVMYKFRSMVIDAEDRLRHLRESNEGNGVLFKIREDPRITRVGRFLRRFSLDELPQLFNVLLGSMSLIGPRPPLPEEVERYDTAAHRRLLVRPGMTGLWQVSGRSLLSWDDTVRLDLYYVENWSFLGDITILMRTVRAVLKREGAF